MESASTRQINAYEGTIRDTAFMHRLRLSRIGKDVIDDNGKIVKPPLFVKLSGAIEGRFKILEITAFAITLGLSDNVSSTICHADSIHWESTKIEIISEEKFRENTPTE